MAIKSNFTKASVPNIGTKRSNPVTTNFAKGVFTYKPNDTMASDELRLAQDARFDRVGEYGTRKGLKALSSNIIGLTATGTASTTPGTYADITDPWTYTASADARICGFRYKALLVGDATKAAILTLTLSVNNEIVDKTAINPAELTSTLAEYDALFNTAPDIKNGDTVKIMLGAQNAEDAENYIELTQTSGALAGQLLTCTAGGVDSIFEANIDGTKTVLFTQNGILYKMAADGTITSIRTLPTGAGTVRYSQNLDQIRYTDGVESPRLIDPNNSWSDTKIDTLDLATDTDLEITPTNIMNGTSDNLIYFASEPDTEAVWTYPYGYTYAKSPAYSTTERIDGQPGDTLTIDTSTITPNYPVIAVGDWITGQGRSTAEVTAISGTTVSLTIVDTTPTVISSYDKFGVDFYQNFPAIKTGDPLTAMFNLAGVMYFQTRRNKYLMYMQSADSWSQQASNAQGGTFSQESVVCDLNYAYYANDNGIYIFDGSSEQSLTQNTIQNAYDAIPNKETIRLDLFKNRLYVFFSSDGTDLDSCFVYNINLKLWESFDANTYIGATSARQNASGRFLCGHSRIGLIMESEAEDGDYSNLGQPLAFNLETSYNPFGQTSCFKRITKWRPDFATTERDYTVECGYALDFTDQVKYAFSIELQRQTAVAIDGYIWDNPSDYGVPAIPTRHTTTPKVNGQFYRCQIRYQHIAAFEPVIFRSHTLTLQTQRIR